MRKAVAEFAGNDECLDHFCAFKVSIELAELVEPEREVSHWQQCVRVIALLHARKDCLILRAGSC